MDNQKKLNSTGVSPRLALDDLPSCVGNRTIKHETRVILSHYAHIFGHLISPRIPPNPTHPQGRFLWMMYPNALFSFFSFFGMVIVSSCLPWNLQAWNCGACLYIIWTALACLTQFVNSIAWTGNIDNKAPIWCDISTKFLIGYSVAIPASSLCINRRIYKMMSTNIFPVTRREKMRVLAEELAIGVGIPLLEMILHYITQGHRFDIFEDIGCVPSIYNTWVAVILIVCWPLAIGIVSTIYSIMNLIIINKSSSRFRLFLSNDNHSLNRQRYWRITGLAAIGMCGTIAISFASIFLDMHVGIQPWVSWEDTHYDFWRVGLFPALVWRQLPYKSAAIEMSRWIPVVCAFTFFAIFGTSCEAKKFYLNAYENALTWCRGRFIRRKERPILVQPRTKEDGRLETRVSLCTVKTVESTVLDISPQDSHKLHQNVDKALPTRPLPIPTFLNSYYPASYPSHARTPTTT
uniref:Putative STE3-like pheromone receptor STE3_Mr7 n=1 Tax=Moniliophthora roreri TaxID=221103 RepID=A0A0W0FUE0_MONRR